MLTRVAGKRHLRCWSARLTLSHPATRRLVRGPRPLRAYRLARMVSTEQLLAFGVAAFVLIAIPGPSVVFMIGRALAYGRGVALATVLGNASACWSCWCSSRSASASWSRSRSSCSRCSSCSGRRTSSSSACRPIRHRRGVRRRTDAAALPCRGRRRVRQGFVVGVSNPKAFMIFAAVLPQFVDRARATCRRRCCCSACSRS